MAGSVAPLYERFRGELYRFVRARVRDEAEAEDILQTAFLRAHRRVLRGDRPLNPRAWLFQIVRNLVVDVARADGRRRSLEAALEVEPGRASVEAGSSPELSDDETAFALVARALPLFIAELDPAHRRALELRELRGLTQAEAARLEGVSLPAMKSRIRRGRQRVYEALDRCCRFEVDARGRVVDATPRSDDACSVGCRSSC